MTTKRTKRFLTVRQLRERWGGVSHMFVERRLREDEHFPQPIKLGRRRFFDEELIEEYERAAVHNYGNDAA
jgi:predicted DNA-binding transcriptional regulator AlpA